MNRTFSGLAALLAMTMACRGSSPATTAAAPATDAWKTPAGWKHETIPFPLDFAPTLAYQGSEELRFMPGFFDTQAPGYWSYVFAWELAAGSAPKSPDALATQLQTYFDGLATAVAEGKFAIESSQLTFAAAPTGEWSGTGWVFDAFKAHRRLALSLSARIRSCHGHDIVLVTVTPSADAAIRTALAAVRDAYPCAQAAQAANFEAFD